VDTRLKADVPVGSYLSGGVDSSMIAALACHLKGPNINTYTIRVDSPELDELDAANLVARHIKTKPPIVQEFPRGGRGEHLPGADPRRRGTGDRYVVRGVVAVGPARSPVRSEKSS
jgi:hypothetical protein